MSIYTFDVKSTSEGIASIEADSMEEAVTKMRQLSSAERVQVNMEMGAGSDAVDFASAREDSNDKHGFSHFQTVSSNADENAEQFEELGG